MKRLTATKRLKSTWINFEPFSSLLRILLGLSIYSFGVYLTSMSILGLRRGTALLWGYPRYTLLNYGGAMAAVSLAAIVIQLLLRERIGIATVLDAIITGNLTQLFCNISP